jgi:D-alanyl-D-alanine dipeptidase
MSQFEPRIAIELRYATERNLAGRAIYPPGSRCLLRRSVAERLIKAQEWLEAHAPAGTRLKIWDAYRPAWAHRELWEARPKNGLLRDPATGGSFHSWGVCVDVTLCNAEGRDLKMPTDFDAMSSDARSIYTGRDKEVRNNLGLLQNAMTKAGFYSLMPEWWHFIAQDYKAFAAHDISLTPKSTNDRVPRDPCTHENPTF